MRGETKRMHHLPLEMMWSTHVYRRRERDVLIWSETKIENAAKEDSVCVKEQEASRGVGAAGGLEGTEERQREDNVPLPWCLREISRRPSDVSAESILHPLNPSSSDHRAHPVPYQILSVVTGSARRLYIGRHSSYVSTRNSAMFAM